MRLMSLAIVLLLCGCLSEQPFNCPKDALTCPDGTTLNRTLPDCNFPECPAKTKTRLSLSQMSLKTDRSLYRSRETMWLNLTIDANREVEAQIWVHGIKSRNQEHLRLRVNRTLEKGTNNLALKYQTPPCNTCYGIREGNYNIIAEVSVEDTLLFTNTTVDIQQ
ncbi:MAG: hypothetical protein GF416_04165 [Candidatus Altiarchaeales archaeon]|nr:hypothetical protein [Candidatus Altiarchaeales archaeon]MBD3416315.1 hypothetical protein [Candidatus Altiarchaeales archaeon]